MVTAATLIKIGNCVIEAHKFKSEIDSLAMSTDRNSLQNMLGVMSRQVEEMIVKLNLTADEVRNDNSS